MAIHPYTLHAYVKCPHAENKDASWDVNSILGAYSWPRNLTGKGKIAIIELGGAYVPTDMALFCSTNNVPMPTVNHVYVGDGAQTNSQDDATGEVMLDSEIAAASYSYATDLPADITYFWCTDIAPGIQAAQAAGMDVFSCSWGDDEAAWGQQAADALEGACAAAVAAGMLIFAASGDNDSSDGGTTPANVDAPASCPHVIGCGGTSKTQNAEVVWNNDPGQASGEGTGGGFSTLFPLQVWQLGVPAAPSGLGRMVPDIAANADPETGYVVVINGQSEVIGGTSAVAPLYAGLAAACGTKLGWIGPKLYQTPATFMDITSGNNGTYKARKGPDACTGLGAPNGTAFAAMLMGQAVPVPAPVPPVAPPVPPVPVPPPTPPVPTPPAPPLPKPVPAPTQAQKLLAQAIATLQELQTLLE